MSDAARTVSDDSPTTPEALEKERADNMELRDQLEAATATMEEENGGGDGKALIPRPSGTAGTDFSIQVAMGLEGVGKRYEKYKAIQVGPLRQQ